MGVFATKSRIEKVEAKVKQLEDDAEAITNGRQRSRKHEWNVARILVPAVL